ncbi:phospholipid N-methyltransferase PmtA [Rhizobium sp.]|jgi:phosphatidylethanolamine/phosphatidyl-N-methylethanolamine N-methyltransferase|uniref:phospholipid N-methyltransferase PmtA n=1 Tax=Rhizobium sp. TaxID=391 RepID=UPI000E945498|nr:SAM-dependent methyltransferase [Rhizobium sp.]
MKFNLKERLEKKFDEEIRFFKGVMQGPKQVGAIVPTSGITARRMASIVNPESGLPVLELGPGTGVITKAILGRGIAPEKLVSVEYSANFYQHLKATIPSVNFIQGNAFDMENTLGPLAGLTFDCVISAVPLLNFPMQERVRLVEDMLDRVPHGRPFMQISYGPMSPVIANGGNYYVQHFDFVVRNIPPAQLWVYRRR